MTSFNKSIRETAPLLAGELIAAALVIIGYAVASAFTQISVIGAALGALLGAAVSVLNHFFLSVSVNRAVDGYLELRGTTPMTDEEAEKFTAEHSMRIQNALRTSFLARTASMLILLVLAFVTGWFSPLATAIPLLLYRPILTLSELIRIRSGAQGAAPVPAADSEECSQNIDTAVLEKNSQSASSDTAEIKEGDE